MLFELPELMQQHNLQEVVMPFTEEEMDGIIKEIPVDIAPGPNGIHGLFFKKCWPLIKFDVYKLWRSFHEGSTNLKSINHSYITLVPKRSNPETVSNFRPVSLLNSCMKFLSKILANRLQKVILKVVHRNQYGFLNGTTIQDCLGWAFEYLY